MSIDRDKIQQAAQKFVDKKKYDKAIIEYQKLVQSDPTDARTLLKIGDLQSKMGAYPEAIHTYEGVGKVYSQQGFALKAIAVYKQIRELIIKHAPHLEERYGHITPKLAELYKQLGLVSDALAALDEVASRLQAQQRDKEAIGVFEKIVELDPTNPLPHLRLAEAFSRVREVDGAVREFGIAAKQLIALGRKDDAIKVYERSLHHRPDEDQARACADLHVARGTREDGLKALAKLQVCFQANPRNLDTLALLSRAFNVIGQAQKGIEVQKEMARIARDAGDLRVFRDIISKLLLLAPNDEAVKRLAGQAGVDIPGEPSLASSDEQHHAGRQLHSSPEIETAPRVDPRQIQHTHQAETRIQEGTRRMHPPAAIEPPLVSEPPAELELEDVEAFDDAEVVDDDAFVEVGGDEVETTDATERHARDLPDVDYGARADALLQEADQMRAAGDLERALEIVVEARAAAPGRMDVLIAERDLLIETGRLEEAVETMLRIATVFVEALDGESAAQALQDVLAYDSHNRRALEMLHELGYEVVQENEQAAVSERMGGQADPLEVSSGSGAYEEPLPSYELAEGEGSSLAPPPAPPSAQRDPLHYAPASHGAAISSGGLHDISDPFDAPAPEFHDSIERQDTANERNLADGGSSELPSFPLDPQAPAALGSTRSASVRAREMELGDALEEVEFFMSRGLTEDARVIVEQQLLRSPNNPLLLEKMQELSASSQPLSGSGARERPPTDFGFNLEDSLSQLDSWMPGPAAEPQGPVDVEEIFEQFKEGVAKQISIDDSQAHYDLGLAYKEMGLLDDAIRELELAGRDHLRVGVVKAMIGGIELERGNHDAALEAFLAGLGADRLDAQQETMLCYEVGLVLEGRGQGDDALQYYERAHNSSPYYRDVEARIHKLRGQGSKVRPAVGDDFDREFDDIIRRG